MTEICEFSPSVGCSTNLRFGTINQCTFYQSGGGGSIPHFFGHHFNETAEIGVWKQKMCGKIRDLWLLTYAFVLDYSLMFCLSVLKAFTPAFPVFWSLPKRFGPFQEFSPTIVFNPNTCHTPLSPHTHTLSCPSLGSLHPSPLSGTLLNQSIRHSISRVVVPATLTQHLCQRSFYKIFVKFRKSKKNCFNYCKYQ